MYDVLLERARESIESIKRHLVMSESFRSTIHDGLFRCLASPPCFSAGIVANPPDRVEWRIIDHCAAVTRIYAIYEYFANAILEEHLGLLQHHYRFLDLPESIKVSYRIGVSRILEKKDGPRYGDLVLADFINGYSAALSGKKYRLETRALLVPEQNLRLKELDRIMVGCGIAGIESWIGAHRSIVAFFGERRSLTTSAGNELAKLISYRNEAAHGSIVVDEVLGTEALLELCAFIEAVCEAISERVQQESLKCLIEKGAAIEGGEVTELLKAKSVIVGHFKGHFRIGDSIYLSGNTYCSAQIIDGIQIQGSPHFEIELTEPTELGLKLRGTAQKGAKVVLLTESAGS